MNRYLTTFVASLCLTAASGTITAAQEYVAPQVVVSTDKVRYNGKVYYSHIVQERQTLYSISKAYNVTLQEIYDANPNLHLNTEGLKKDQIILIPIKEGVTQTPTRTTKVETTADNKADSGDDKAKEYTIHRVKWFEDLTSIARKYMVSKESIMNINGMTSEKVRRKDKIKIPTHPEKWEKGSGYEVASAGSSTEGTSTESGSSTGAVTGDDSTGSENARHWLSLGVRAGFD